MCLHSAFDQPDYSGLVLSGAAFMICYRGSCGHSTKGAEVRTVGPECRNTTRLSRIEGLRTPMRVFSKKWYCYVYKKFILSLILSFVRIIMYIWYPIMLCLTVFNLSICSFATGIHINSKTSSTNPLDSTTPSSPPCPSQPPSHPTNPPTTPPKPSLASPNSAGQ